MTTIRSTRLVAGWDADDSHVREQVVVALALQDGVGLLEHLRL